MMKKLMVIMLGVVVLLTACGGAKQTSSMKVGDFAYTDQAGQAFGLADVKGKVWLADFVFTNCTSVCQPMTFNLTDLQKRIKAENLDVTFVSFSVDPDRDKPEVMKAFADKFGVDFASWHFLTNYKLEDIKAFAKSSFKTIVEKEPSSDQMIHGTSFYLVSKEGYIMKKYDGVEDVPYDQIIKDIKDLA
nr:SCO family protein [Paenibacillus terrigena]